MDDPLGAAGFDKAVECSVDEGPADGEHPPELGCGVQLFGDGETVAGGAAGSASTAECLSARSSRANEGSVGQVGEGSLTSYRLEGRAPTSGILVFFTDSVWAPLSMIGGLHAIRLASAANGCFVGRAAILIG